MGISESSAKALRIFPPSTLLEPYLDFFQFMAFSEDRFRKDSIIEEEKLLTEFYKFCIEFDDKIHFKNKKSLLSSTAKEIIKKLYSVGFLGCYKNYVQDIDWKTIGNFYGLLKHIEKSEERKVKWALYYYLKNRKPKKQNNPLNDVQELVEGLNISNLKKISSKVMKSHTDNVSAHLETLMDPDLRLSKSATNFLIEDLEWTSRRSPGELEHDVLELLDEGSYSNQELSILLNTSKPLISKAMNRLKSNNDIAFSSHGTRGSNYYTTNCDNCPFGKDIVSCRYDAGKSIKNTLKTKFNFEISESDLKLIETNQAVLRIKRILDNTKKHQTSKMELNINQNLNSIFSQIMENHLKSQISKAKGQAYVRLDDMLAKMPPLYILGFVHGSQNGASLMDTFIGQVLKDKIPEKDRQKLEKEFVQELNRLKSILKE